MVYTRTLLFGISISTLALFAGCASSPSRAAHAPGTSESTQTHAPDSAPESPAVFAQTPSDAFVIGEEFLPESVPQYPSPINEYTMSEIQAELEAMYDRDQQLIAQIEKNTLNPAMTPGTIHLIDQAHGRRLKEIVDHIGWPTRELVGLKGTQAAYMVIQHGGDDIAFQNRCLELMVDLVAQGELPASYVALLTDRIRVFQGEPQVFGTQMEMALNDVGVLVPTPTVPIEDPENLDHRRKLMGMPSHTEYVHAIEIAYQASKVDPNNAFAHVPTSDE